MSPFQEHILKKLFIWRNISASPTRNHIELQADPEFEPAQMMARVPMPFSTIVSSSRAPSVVILDDASRVSVYPCVPLEPMKIPTRKSNLTHTLCAEECPINSLNSTHWLQVKSPPKISELLELLGVSILGLVIGDWDPEVSSTDQARGNGPIAGGASDLKRGFREMWEPSIPKDSV